MRRKNVIPPDRGSDTQSINVGGLGTKGGSYKTRVRAVTHAGVPSDWTNEVTFTLTDSTEGTASDPNLPNTPTNVVIKGMLNAIYVEFDDEFFSTTKPLMANNMGSYEIEISNVSDQFPSSGNSWTQTVGSHDETGPPGGDTRKFKVPTGDGFICTGMKSTAAGLTHYVRVRGINADGTAGAWDGSSPTKSVVLDTDDESQTAVIIGENAIFATHIKSGTITAQEILAGTITASEISSGQVFASEIRLPAANPGTGGDASEFHATRKFTIDLNGNMWWGNYADIDDAKAGTVVSGSNASTSWIDDTGNTQFIGTISTGAGAPNNILATGDDGEARMVLGDSTGSLFSGGDSDGGYGYLLGFTGHNDEELPGHAVFTYEDSGNHRYGAAYLVAPRFHGGSTDGVDDYLGSSNDRFKYAGVRLRDPKISHHVHEGTVPNNNSTANTIYLAATASSTNDIYNDHTIHVTISGVGVQSRTITDYVGSTKVATVSPNWDTTPQNTATYKMSGFGEAILVHPADMDYMGIVSGPRPEGSGTAYSEVMGVVTAPGGLRVTSHAIAPGTPGGLTLDSGTPATGSTETGSNRNKLWNDGGTLKWGAGAVGGGSSNFLPTSQSGTNLAYVDVDGDDVEIFAVKTITTTSDTGNKGLSVTNGSNASTGVSLALGNLDISSIQSSDYVPFTTQSGGTWYNYKVTVSNLANSSSFTDKFLLLSGGTMVGGSTITGSTGSGLVIRGNSNQSGNLRANNDSSKGVEVQSGGTVKLWYGSTVKFWVTNTYLRGEDPFRVPSGTAGAPTFTFNSDADTGMWNAGTNVVAFSTNGTERVRIDASGNLMVGYTSSSYKFAASGTCYFSGYTYHSSGGKAYPAFSPWSTYNGSYPADLGTSSLYWRNVYLQSHVWASDIKVKSNVADATYGLDFVKQLRPVTYNMEGATGRSGARTHHGFIAQEIETLLGDAADGTALWTNSLSEAQPEMDGPDGSTIAATEEEWNQGLRYEQFIPILTKAIQELEARIAALEG